MIEIDTEAPEVTPVLVWEDGAVSIGRDRLHDYLMARGYGYADEHPKQIWVNVKGELVRVHLNFAKRVIDLNDWIDETWTLVPEGNETKPLLTIGLRLDGRA